MSAPPTERAHPTTPCGAVDGAAGAALDRQARVAGYWFSDLHVRSAAATGGRSAVAIVQIWSGSMRW